jgi:hypothetical protein
MYRSSSQHHRTRRPALDPCEDRILQSVMVEPLAHKATQPQETAHTLEGSRIAVHYNATSDQVSRVFDDPFFFDVN